MNIKEFAEKFIKAEYEAWQKGNFDKLEKIEDTNMVHHYMEFDQELVGHEAHKQFIIAARQAASSIHQEWKYLTGEGNLFALSYKSRSEWKGNLPGFPPLAGKETTAYTLFLFRLNDGKIVKGWENGIVTGFG
jgi:predicted ester cyclase